MRDASRRFRVLPSLLLGALSLVACLATLEAAVRIFFHDEIDTEVLRHLQTSWSLRGLVEPSADETLLFELRQNLFGLFAGVLVVTGPDRYRVGTTAGSGPGQVRVAVLGDSTPFGWGVSWEETYPALFRQGMEESSGRTVELRNFSVPGYNALQELRTFETKVRPWRPDLVIVHHDHNDAEPAAKMMGADYMPAEYGDNLLHSALAKWTVRRLRRMRNDSARAAMATGHRLVAGYLAAGPLYDAQLEARRRLVEEARASGAPVVIVIFNAFVTRSDRWERSEVYTALHRDLAARLAAMGYEVLDLFPLYQAALREHGWADLKPWWHSVRPADAHPSPEGQRFIADRLVEYVRGDALLAAVFGLRAPGAGG